MFGANSRQFCFSSFGNCPIDRFHEAALSMLPDGTKWWKSDPFGGTAKVIHVHTQVDVTV